jgi:hypothetical protein
MIETKTVHSFVRRMTCDFCRSEIYSGEAGDEWLKALFRHSVDIKLPSLCGETAVIHLCHNCQLKMRLLFERARKHGKSTNPVSMLDVNSIEHFYDAGARMPDVRLEATPANPRDKSVCDSYRHFAIYF